MFLGQTRIRNKQEKYARQAAAEKKTKNTEGGRQSRQECVEKLRVL